MIINLGKNFIVQSILCPNSNLGSKENFGDYSLHKRSRTGLSYPKRRKGSRPFAELEADMTLCMAAICDEGVTPRIVIGADARVEVGWAGANVGFKLNWAGQPGWPAMLAGEVSKAEDLLATYRSVLKPKDFNRNNIFDKMNEASCAHKEKLCERHVRARLGISFDRFLTKGEHELSPETRRQVLYELQELNFGCELIILGYIDSKHPYIFTVDGSGEVTRHQSFASIGTGSIIANATLYQRGQGFTLPIETTLYNLYEGARLARIAPGVGEIENFLIIDHQEGGSIGARHTNNHYLQCLEKSFAAFGPKPTDKLFEFNSSCFRTVGAPAQPSDSQTSEDQPSPYSEASQETDQTSSDD